MSLTMNLGTLFVSLDAKTTGLLKGLAKGSAALDKFSRETKKLAKDIAQVGLGLTAFSAGMLAAASTADRGVAKSMERLRNSFLTVAVQISKMLQPAVEALSGMLRTLADYIAGLDPATRAAVGQWGAFVAIGGAVAAVLSQLMPLLGAVASGFRVAFAGLAAVGLPGLLIIGALATGIALLHKAWRENWGGMQQVVKSAFTQMGQWAEAFFGAMREGINGWIDMLVSVAKTVTGLLIQLDVLRGKISPAQGKQAIGFANLGYDTMGSAAKNASPKAIFSAAADVAKEGVGTIVDEWKLMLGELGDLVKGVFPDFKKGHAPAAKPLEKESTQALGDAYRRMMEGYERQASYKGPRRLTGGATAARADVGTKEASAEFWQGMEGLGPTGARLVGTLKQFASGLSSALQSSLGQIGAALANGARALVSKMGDLGEVIQSGVQGFESGGIWGAIVGVLVDVFARFERFVEIIDVGTGQLLDLIGDLSGPLGEMVDAFKTVMGSIGMIANVLHSMIAPLLSAFAESLEMIAPFLVIISVVMKAIAPMFQVLGGVMKLSHELMGPALKLFFEAVKYIAMAVLWVADKITTAWNWMVTQIHKLISSLPGMDKLAASISGLFITENFAHQFDELSKMSWDTAMAMANTAASAYEAAGANQRLKDSVDDINESLSNVPSWYKVAGQRHAAANAEGANVTSPMAVPGIFNIGTMVVQASDPQELQRSLRREAYKRTGNPAGNPFGGR